MPKGCVLLDTSFFIRLLKEDDRLHQNTVEYFKYFLENDYTLKVSTIAISEFCVKGTVDMLPLANMQILPFNYDHAVNSGRLGEIAFRKKKERGAVITPRTVVPSDTKMFAQADLEEDITHYVSADSEATKVFSLINEEYKMKFDYVDISVSHRQVFGELF